MHEIAALISVVMVVMGVGKYIMAVLGGKVKPSRATWWIFTGVSVLILITTLLSDKPNPSIWQLWIFAITALFVAVTSQFKGVKQFGFYDKVCVTIASIAIVVWLILWSNPNATKIVLLLGILARFMGVVPTIIKTYHKPDSEDMTAWIILTLATWVNLFGVQEWSWEHWTVAAFPVYAVIETAPVIFLILYHEATRKRFALS
jgi:hypothetical protein